VFEEPQSREQLRVYRITILGLAAQPFAGLRAWHLMHDDVLGVVAAAGADFLQVPGAHEGDHLGAHAR
jgi:hypothetical protein